MIWDDLRRARELLRRSSIGAVMPPDGVCYPMSHQVSGVAARAAWEGKTDRTRCIKCGTKLHLERTYLDGRLWSEFWVEGW